MQLKFNVILNRCVHLFIQLILRESFM